VQFACRIENPERCIKQSAPIAVKNVKFRSNRILAGQFTAEIVGQREGDREDLDIRFYLIARRLLQFLKIFFPFLSIHCINSLFLLFQTQQMLAGLLQVFLV